MPKFNLISWAKKGFVSWWSYWRESLNAGQETHDFMLYSLVTLLIIVATILTLSGVKLPDLDLSDPTPHIVLVVFELTLITWILLYLPYKRHKAEEYQHTQELVKLKKARDQEIEWLNQQIEAYNEIKPLVVEPLIKNSHCYLRISNPNNSGIDADLKLINIEPPMKGPIEREYGEHSWPYQQPIYHSDGIELEAAIFDFYDSQNNWQNNWLNIGETRTIELFAISKGKKTVSLLFFWQMEKSEPRPFHRRGRTYHNIHGYIVQFAAPNTSVESLIFEEFRARVEG